MDKQAPVYGGPLDGAEHDRPYFWVTFIHKSGAYQRHVYRWNRERDCWEHAPPQPSVMDKLLAKYEPLTPENLLRKDRKNHGR